MTFPPEMSIEKLGVTKRKIFQLSLGGLHILKVRCCPDDTDQPFLFSFCRLEVRPVKRIEAVSKGNYVCTMCDPQVTLEGAGPMQEHAQNVHQGAKFACDSCNFVTGNSLRGLVNHRLQQHQVATEGYQSFKCPDCKFYTSQKYLLRDHMLSKTHHNHQGRRQRWEPSTTPNVGKFKLPDIEYAINENREKCRKCFICDELVPVSRKSDSDRSGIDRHCKELHNMKQYKCHLCGKQMRLRQNFAFHLKTQHSIDCEGYEFIECHYPACGFVCKTKWDFGIHLSYHLSKYEDMLGSGSATPARVGPKWLGAKWATGKPIPVKEDPVALQCDICGMTMTNKDPQLQLELHLKMEHSLESLLCPHCGESFSDEYTLSVHTKSKHMPCTVRTSTTNYYDPTDRKPCPLCPDPMDGQPAKLYGPSSLPYHMKSHTSVLMCPINACPRSYNKSFPTEKALLNHFRDVHLNYRQFKCLVCTNASFKNLEKIRDHVLFHHAGMPEKRGKVAEIKALGSDFFDKFIMDLKMVEPDTFMDDARVKDLIEKYKSGLVPSNISIYEKAPRNCISKYKAPR